jgi:hypothetical protein
VKSRIIERPGLAEQTGAGGRPHSGDSDRVDEAWRWLVAQLGGRPVPPLFVLIGLGDGYLLDALELHAPATRVLALEPDPAAAAAFLARRDWRTWRDSGRLAYLVDPDYAGADEAWRIFPIGVVAPPVLVYTRETASEGALRAVQHLKRIIFGVKANDEARRQFAPRYLVNSIRNIPAIVAGRDVRALTDTFRGVPAIIAGAGPSLDTAISELPRWADRALLISTDTALRPLLCGGLAPQFVVGVDPSAVNARHLLSLPECKNTWLVGESALDRQATALFEGRTFWFHVSNHHPWPWLNELGIDAGGLKAWGSVLTSAFEFAVLAGCDPIVFVGADLSFTGGRPYARGTTYEFDWAQAAAAGLELEEVWRRQMSRSETHALPDLRGVETMTTPALLSFRDWMIAHAKRSGRRVINATGAGMLFGDGVEQASLPDVLSRVSSERPSFADLVPPSAERVSRAGVSARLREIRDRIAGGVLAGSPTAEWAEFSGDGFDGAAVGAALDEAAATLEATRPVPDAGAIAGNRLIPSEASRRVFDRLPEAIRRFRAALNGIAPLRPIDGDAPPDGDTMPDGEALLADAAALFPRICEAILSQRGDLVATPYVTRDDVPVSMRYAWPDNIRWAVEMFEGMLGCAWPPAAAPARFFTPRAPAGQDHSGAAATSTQAPGNARFACVLLACEWLRCRHSLSVEMDGSLATIELPFTPCDAALLRPYTGTLCGPGGPAPAPLTDIGRHWPRVLFDEPTGGPFLAYGTLAGAVAIRPHARESSIAGADGTLRTHHVWPRPILNELPFGQGGAVAWGSGPTHEEPHYVMYRQHAGGEVHVQQLSIRPVNGGWWRGRLYWSCFSWIESWFGVASWAPGEEPRLELPGLTLHALQPESDALILHPCTYRTRIGYERRVITKGWKWQGGEAMTPIDLGPYGAASSRDSRGEWTATAHPEADVIRFEAHDGRVCSMICHAPLRVVWDGDDTLLVGTAQRVLLRFEGLTDRLNRAASACAPLETR